MDSPLTPLGIEQAKKLGQRLLNVKFDAVFSSDLGRAKRTAELVAIEHKLLVITNAALREFRFGEGEGMKTSEYRDKFQQTISQRDRLLYKDRINYRVSPGSETINEMLQRVTLFMREVAALYRGKKVLLVSHGGVLRHILIHFNFATEEELPYNSVQNTACIIIKTDGAEFKVVETMGVTKKRL